ncbi:MAG: AAA family ATPase [Muribaculaceae bacterium]|nr:AAA family ATPase [Muribaculaceae bacterium]
MTAIQLADAAYAVLPFAPNTQQAVLINALAAFITDGKGREVFVLNGYAGTGKSSVIGALVKALEAARIRSVILAPTGRAAKVASHFASHKASTIHKRLYRGNSSDPSNTSFFLAPNHDRDTIFFVDEASLITDSNDSQSLLGDLVRHVYSAPGCKMILIGDIAQLPPVGQTRSAAMEPTRLRELGLEPICATLDIPARQKEDSGILLNSYNIRKFLFGDFDSSRFALSVRGYEDVKAISSNDLADYLSDSWSTVGQDETLIITRSNKRANKFNQAIRNLVMGADTPLQRGDRIVIARNDYYWSRINKLSSFIANGDTAEVTWVGRTEKAYGRYFVDVELTLTADGATVGAKLMLRSLVAEGPSIPREEMERLYARVMADCDGELSQKIKHAEEDPYYNSLQAKYAYCVTCHKAQGGQWRHIYIDMGALTVESVCSDFYRWLYTALTRSTSKVFLINPHLPLR